MIGNRSQPYVCMYVCMYVCVMYVCMYVSMYVCMCDVCMYVGMYVCICSKDWVIERASKVFSLVMKTHICLKHMYTVVTSNTVFSPGFF